MFGQVATDTTSYISYFLPNKKNKIQGWKKYLVLCTVLKKRVVVGAKRIAPFSVWTLAMSSTLLSTAPERYSQNQEWRRSATPFYQNERCGSCTHIFWEERKYEWPSFSPLFWFAWFFTGSLEHERYGYN